MTTMKAEKKSNLKKEETMKNISKLVILTMAVSLMSAVAFADPIVVRYNTSVSSGGCPQNSTGNCAYHAATNTTTLTATDTSDGDTVTLTYFGVGNVSTSSYVD